MRVLWVATKPPWPAIDGGRLLSAGTLAALRERGARVTIATPFDPESEDAAALAPGLAPLGETLLVPGPRRGLAGAMARALRTGSALTVVRHESAAVREAVARELDRVTYDVVHAEQLHAFAQCGPALERGFPVVLRCQNVETELWSAGLRRGALRRLLRARELPRIARAEAAAVRRAAVSIALCEEDAARLRELAGRAGRIHVIGPPFAEVLPAGPALPGAPALVLLGSRGWPPNDEGLAWFASAVWPLVRQRLAGAVVHVFGMRWPASARGGPGEERVIEHAAPAESVAAFARGAILVVPLWTASGVRMKILEAWARGVPVVATGAAARGLGARAGHELLIEDTAEGVCAGVASLHERAGLARSLVAAGRQRLAEHHRPSRIADALLEVYREVAGGP